MLHLGFGVGIQELLIIFGIGLLLFGAKKLPELARAMGGSITQFKKGLKEGEADADAPPGRIESKSQKPGSSGSVEEEKRGA
jgi:sec-independent protein translocase protein TatA